MFDTVSDLHLERAFPFEIDEKQWRTALKSFFPKHPSSLLVIAGDISEYINQTVYFFRLMREVYPIILYVNGNNDLTVPSEIRNKEQWKRTNEKLERIREETEKIGGIIHLDGNLYTHEGVIYGGCDLFFDFDSLKKHHLLTDSDIALLWKQKRMDEKHKGLMDDPEEYLKQEKKKLQQVVSSADVIVTHGPPDYFYQTEEAVGFFTFDGSPYQLQLQGKVWVYGHLHQASVKQRHGCTFLNPSLGMLEAGKTITSYTKKHQRALSL